MTDVILTDVVLTDVAKDHSLTSHCLLRLEWWGILLSLARELLRLVAYLLLLLLLLLRLLLVGDTLELSWGLIGELVLVEKALL